MNILYKYPILERLQGLKVFNKNGLDIINTYKDDEHTFLFIDPPYTEKNESSEHKRSKIYQFEMLKDSEQVEFCHYYVVQKQKYLCVATKINCMI
mgnify:CR=1 FL=1